MVARRTRRKRREPASTGLSPSEIARVADGRALAALEEALAGCGGSVLARYRDPIGGRPLLLAALPLSAVAPTPFQRDLSDAHVRRLEQVVEKVGIFLDPVVAVPSPEGTKPPFWSPNGRHRLAALERLGARSVVALVSPETELAYRILALNTEKAHSLRERALEVVRMAEGLAEADPRGTEQRYALELEEPALITLGLAYQARPRFAGGAWSPALRGSDEWIAGPLARALERRRGYAERLLALDERVSEIVSALRERGFESPYLRNFVVARLRPFRRRGERGPALEDLLTKMERSAARFDVERIRPEQLARAAAPAAED